MLRLNGMIKKLEYAGDRMASFLWLISLIRRQAAENFKYSIERVFCIQQSKRT